jgi:hypothetical protein
MFHQPGKTKTMDKQPRKRIPVQKPQTISLEELKASIINDGVDWLSAEQMMKDGKLMKAESWPDGQFLFLRKDNSKYINKKTTPGAFYPPITMEFLQRIGVEHFVISKHYNRWIGKGLWVGYGPTMKEKAEMWREITI